MIAKIAFRRQSSMSASRLSRRIASDGTMPWLIMSRADFDQPPARERSLLDERKGVGQHVELTERTLRRHARRVPPAVREGRVNTILSENDEE